MARGGYSFDDIEKMSNLDVNFLYYYQELAEQKRWDNLSAILGTNWDLDAIRKNATSSEGNDGPPASDLFVPLSLIINPEFDTYLRQRAGVSEKKSNVPYVGGGEYTPDENTEIISFADLSKEDLDKLTKNFRGT